MNRRGFLQGLFAAAAFSTGLARTRLDLVLDPLRERDLMALLARKIRAAEADMRAQIEDAIYSGYDEVRIEEAPAVEKASYSWRQVAAVTIQIPSR